MSRKLLFSALTALALAGGLLMASAIPGDTAPVVMSPVPQVQVNGNLIQVKSCGPWNNWCQPSGPKCGPWNDWCGGGGSNCGPWNDWCGDHGGGGDSACINLGGVQFCVGGSGSNCQWHNGVKYCNNFGGGGSCVIVNGHKYCTYKHKNCILVNGTKYCRYN